MGKTAFIDLRGPSGGEIYVYEGRGRGPVGFGRIVFSIDETGAIRPDARPEGVTDCALGLPLEMLDFRLLELPIGEPDRVREVLPFELEGLVLGPVDELVLDAVVLGPSGGGHRVLAVYMKKDLLRRLLEALSSVGLDPRTAASLELGEVIRGVSEGGAAEGGLEAALLRSGGGGGGEGGEPIMDPALRPEAAHREIERPCINLRRGELAFTKEMRSTMRALALGAALLAASLIVFGVDTGLKLRAANREIGGIERMAAGAYADALPLPNEALSKEALSKNKPDPSAGQAYKLKASLAALEKEAASLRGLGALNLLYDLTEAMPKGGVKLTSLSADQGIVVLKGGANDLARVEEVKARLEGFLRDVKIAESAQGAGGAMAFTITARAGGTADPGEAVTEKAGKGEAKK